MSSIDQQDQEAVKAWENMSQEERNLIKALEKVQPETTGSKVYRGRNFVHRKITDKGVFELLAGAYPKDKELQNVVFGVPAWVKVPNEVDDEGRSIYSAFTVDDKEYPKKSESNSNDGHTDIVNKPNDNHKIASGIIGFVVSNEKREYFDTENNEVRAVEEISLKTSQGIVKPQFVERTFKYLNEGEDKNGNKDNNVKRYEGLRITERYSVSINGKDGELQRTTVVRAGLPAGDEFKLQGVSHNMVESLIVNLDFTNIEKPDKLQLAMDNSFKVYKLDQTLQPITITKGKTRSLKAFHGDKFLIGEKVFGEKGLGNKEYLHEVAASQSNIKLVYSGFKGPILLQYGDIWTTSDPTEDGHVIEDDGLRYGTTVSGCVAGNDIYIEVPAGYVNKRRAYFQFDISYFAPWAGTLNVTQIRFRCNRVQGNTATCVFRRLDNAPTSRACPYIAADNIYAQIYSGTLYRTTSLPAGNNWTIISDRNPNTPAIPDTACNDLQTKIANNIYWFAFGARKASETSGAGFQIQIQGEEYDVAADPKPTLEVTYTV